MGTRIHSRTRRERRRAAAAGELPAEALPTEDREALIRDLHALGWSDAHIAAHTLESTHTIARICDRLGLRSNPEDERV